MPTVTSFLNHHTNKIRRLWLNRFDEDNRCMIRRSLRMIRNTRDNNGILQVPVRA
jgi:hypothetical protein